MAVKRHQQHFDVTAKDGTGPALASVERNLKGVERSAMSMADTFRAVLGATVMAGFTRQALTAAIESEKASNRLNATLRATGYQAGITRKELDQLAASMQEGLGFDDESVMAAQAELLKFGNIHDNVFREALKLSADLAAFMGSDIPTAAQMVGKSLQSPTEGLQMMERQFGKLTEEQEANINSLVEQGRAIEAQQAVLDIWRSKVGGVAAEMNTGLTKATRDVTNAWDDLMETLGAEGQIGNRALGGMTALLRDIKGELEGVRTPLRGLMEDVQTWAERLNPVYRMVMQIRRAHSEGPARPGPTVSGQIRGAVDWDAIAEGWENASAASHRVVKLGGKKTPAGGGKSPLAKRTEEEMDDAVKRYRVLQDERERDAKKIEDSMRSEIRTRQEALRYIDEHGQFDEVVVPEMAKQYERTLTMQEAMAVRMVEVTDEANAFDFTFNSALEDAIINGGKLSDVVRGLAADLQRMVLRKTLTEPLGNLMNAGINSLISGWSTNAGGPTGDVMMTGGTFADGGRPPVGRVSLVGEEGPELFVPDRAGTIIPNHALGGGGTVVVNQTIQLSTGVSATVRSEVMAMMPQIKAAAVDGVAEARRRGGSFAKAFGA